MEPRFADRVEAGRQLGLVLRRYADQPRTLVIGIPRGGVVTAFEVAQILRLPLDIFVVRKLGVPGQEELAMGALASGGFYILDYAVIDALRITDKAIQATLRREERELLRRERLYRQGREALPVEGATLILVDDGLATGSSIQAAIRVLRTRHPARLVVAVPVAPPDTARALQTEVDEFVCLQTPEPFNGVGWWYEDFSPTSDEQVSELLERAQSRVLSQTPGASPRHVASG